MLFAGGKPEQKENSQDASLIRNCLGETSLREEGAEHPAMNGQQHESVEIQGADLKVSISP